MTPSILDDPQHWRERAVEARRVADKLDDPIAKAAMLRIASDYGQIAEQAQLRAAGAGRSRSASDEDDSAHPQTRQRLPVGRSKDWLKFKNPDAPAVKREAEEDWNGRRAFP